MAKHHVAKTYIVYVGGYTRMSGKGVYAFRFTPATGDMEPLGLIQPANNPSWIDQDPAHRLIFAVNEHPAKGQPTTGNSVSAYARDPKTGKLTFLNTVSSKGTGPAHLSVDHTGKLLIVANFGSSNVATFPINPDGALSEAATVAPETGTVAGPAVAKDENGLSPTDPHIHCAMVSPDNRFLLACNVGLGQVWSYRLNAQTGALTQVGEPFIGTPLPGKRWRPRHLAFDPSGRFVYIMDSSTQITTAAYDPATGTLTEIQSLPIDTGYAPGQSTEGSEVRVDRAGRFVYTSTHGVDASLKSVPLEGTLNVFAVDPRTHTLTSVQHILTGGAQPRTFVLDPSGKFLLVGNENSSNVAEFAVDQKTGRLTPTGKVITEIGEPSAFVFDAEP
jgi:6-phosphogluconolactonase